MSVDATQSIRGDFPWHHSIDFLTDLIFTWNCQLTWGLGEDEGLWLHEIHEGLMKVCFITILHLIPNCLWHLHVALSENITSIDIHWSIFLPSKTADTHTKTSNQQPMVPARSPTASPKSSSWEGFHLKHVETHISSCKKMFERRQTWFSRELSWIFP